MASASFIIQSFNYLNNISGAKKCQYMSIYLFKERYTLSIYKKIKYMI